MLSSTCLLYTSMSCLSAFVHPLRLTFVEYFKNSGYEGKGEAYKPFTAVSYTHLDFKTELYPALSEDDKKLIDLFYLKFDNANVLKLLKDKMCIRDR